MAPRYKVTLTINEREFLETLIHTGSTDAKKFVKARALLPCDAGKYGSAWKASDVAQAFIHTLLKRL